MANIILSQGNTILPEEKTFPKVNTLFLDMLKNKRKPLSDIPEQSSQNSTEKQVAEIDHKDDPSEDLPVSSLFPIKSSELLDGSETATSPSEPSKEDDKPKSIFVKVKRKPLTPTQPKRTRKPNKTPVESSPSDTEAQKKSEIAFQYEILRKLYPDAKIPTINRFAPLTELENDYSIILRKIEMATTIDKSKKVFVMVLLGSELFLGKMGLDMAGFTLDQLNNMESYNEVLYELGKKYAIVTQSKIEPELKLVGLLLFSIMAHLVSRSLEASGSDTIATIVQQSTKHTFKHLFG